VDWREFFASVVDSLAWPVVVLASVLLLRRQIVGLFDGTLSRLKLGPGGIEAEFERGLDAAAASTARALPAPQGPDVEDRLETIEEMIDSTPVVAIRMCFDVVLDELRRLMDARDVAVPDTGRPRPPASALIKAAYHGRAISKPTGEALRALDTLVRLTDEDPSGTKTTPANAREFFTIARTTLFALDIDRPAAS
jgi:hypothetical protein